MKHELKTWPDPFQAVWEHKKLFEIRFNDRDYKRGDTLLLREYDPEKGYTAREVVAHVVFILKPTEANTWGLQPGFVALGINIISKSGFHHV